MFPLEEIGAGHVTGKISFYRSNWKKIGRILSLFIALYIGRLYKEEEVCDHILIRHGFKYLYSANVATGFR